MTYLDSEIVLWIDGMPVLVLTPLLVHALAYMLDREIEACDTTDLQERWTVPAWENIDRATTVEVTGRCSHLDTPSAKERAADNDRTGALAELLAHLIHTTDNNGGQS